MGAAKGFDFLEAGVLQGREALACGLAGTDSSAAQADDERRIGLDPWRHERADCPCTFSLRVTPGRGCVSDAPGPTCREGHSLPKALPFGNASWSPGREACREKKEEPGLIEQIKVAIRSSGRSLSELGTAAGVPKRALSRFLRDERGLTGANLDKLCRALGYELTRARTPNRPRRNEETLRGTVLVQSPCPVPQQEVCHSRSARL